MSISRPVPAARACVGFGTQSAWEHALADAATALTDLEPDLIIVVCGSAFRDEMPAIANEIGRAFHVPCVFGASGRGVIAQDIEHDQPSTLAMMGLRLPGALLSPVHLSRRSLVGMTDAATCHRRLNVIPGDVNGWLMLANPVHFDAQRAISTLAMAYPGTPIVGGLVAPDAGSRQTALLVDAEATFDGAIALGIGGPYDLLPMVSHGCEPIGQTWTITGVVDDWIETIGGQPALHVIDTILRSTPHDLRERTRRNLLVGLAADEYRAEFARGDFIVRSIVGINQQSGAIAVGAEVRVGQTLQFQLRDALTADQDLGNRLEQLRGRCAEANPLALLAFAGQERGAGLFGAVSHDARAVQRALPGLPTLGLTTTGEIGPVGGRTALQTMSFTAGLITSRSEPDPEKTPPA